MIGMDVVSADSETEDLLIECARCKQTETFGTYHPRQDLPWGTLPHRLLQFINLHQQICFGVNHPLPKQSPFVLRLH